MNNHDVVPLYCMLTTREALLQYDHKASFFIIMIIINKASPGIMYIYLYDREAFFLYENNVISVFFVCYVPARDPI